MRRKAANRTTAASNDRRFMATSYGTHDALRLAVLEHARLRLDGLQLPAALGIALAQQPGATKRRPRRWR